MSAKFFEKGTVQPITEPSEGRTIEIMTQRGNVMSWDLSVTV